MMNEINQNTSDENEGQNLGTKIQNDDDRNGVERGGQLDSGNQTQNQGTDQNVESDHKRSTQMNLADSVDTPNGNPKDNFDEEQDATAENNTDELAGQENARRDSSSANGIENQGTPVASSSDVNADQRDLYDKDQQTLINRNTGDQQNNSDHLRSL